MLERPPLIEALSIEAKESTREKERKRHAEEGRIREAERPYLDWANSYALVHLKIVPDIFVKKNFQREIVDSAIHRLRRLEQTGSADAGVLKFRDGTRDFIRSLGLLTQEKHGLARIYQTIGREKLTNPSETKKLWNPFLLAALWKESLRGLPKSKDAVGRLGAWILRSSREKVWHEISKVASGAPQLFRYDASAYHEVDLPEMVRQKLPKNFYTDPTRFIENLTTVERRQNATRSKFEINTVENQIRQPYDTARTRQFEDVVFKRVDLQLVEQGKEEKEVADKVRKELVESRLNIKVSAYHGIVYDHGNIYLVAERIHNSINLAERAGYDHVLKQLTEAGFPCNSSNVLVQYRTPEMRLGEEVGFWLVDFENSRLASVEEAQYEKHIPRTHAPRIERSADDSEIKARSDRYEAQGITVEFAHELVELVEEKHGKGEYKGLSGQEHLEVFYLNFSDAIELLEKHLDVRGEHVITVGGNSDFAKIFLEKGAQKIDIFDISLPAVFYNELCIVALKELNLEGYKDFVNFWKMNEGRKWEDRLDFLSVFDARIYKALRVFLSEQARTYFDELIQHPDLFQERGEYYGSFVQTRRENTSGGKEFTVIGDLIKDVSTYADLQEKARNADVSFTWASVNAMAEYVARANGVDDYHALGSAGREALFPEHIARRFAGVDTVYISNIDYHPKLQIRLAKLFLQAGVGRVLLAMSGERLGYKSDEEYIDKSGNIIRKKSQEDGFYEWYNQHRDEVRKLVKLDERPIHPSDVLEYIGVNVHVIDYTDRVEFGMVVEIRNDRFMTENKQVLPPVPSKKENKKEKG
ncbi:MAG: hypothetical protein ABH861_03050 [Patescibacteria group bacterium]|nr:hypothetical protein [Patescibacteria group bacterium]